MIFFVALRKELLEQWRSYRLLIAVAVLVAFGLLSPVAAKFTPELMKLLPQGEEIAKIIPPPALADAVAQYIKNISQFGVILALLMTMGTVAQEKERGTAAVMLVKPMPRAAFLGAKFAAISLTLTISIALAGLAAYCYTWLLFEPLRVMSWLALNVLITVFVLVWVALTLLFSTVSRSQAVAAGLALTAITLSALIGSLPGVGKYAPGELLAWAGGWMAGRQTASWPALWASLTLIGGALAAAWAAFERQEL